MQLVEPDHCLRALVVYVPRSLLDRWIRARVSQPRHLWLLAAAVATPPSLNRHPGDSIVKNAAV